MVFDNLGGGSNGYLVRCYGFYGEVKRVNVDTIFEALGAIITIGVKLGIYQAFIVWVYAKTAFKVFNILLSLGTMR